MCPRHSVDCKVASSLLSGAPVEIDGERFSSLLYIHYFNLIFAITVSRKVQIYSWEAIDVDLSENSYSINFQ